MTAIAAAAPRKRARPLGAVASRDALALGALTVLLALLTVLTWSTWGDLGADTGYDLVAGARVAHGQLPYVDFIYYYGPLAPFLLGFAGLVGGGGIGPAVGLGLVLAFAIVFATYVLGRMYAGAVGGFFAGALAAPIAFAPTNFSFVMPHTYSATLGLLATLCFLIALGSYAKTGALRWLVGAGVAAGLVALTRPEFEVAVLAAAGIWLALRLRDGIGRVKEVALFVVLALGIPAAVYGAFLVRVSPHRLLFDNLYPVDALRAGPDKLFKAYAPLTPSSFAALGAKLLLYVGGTLALIAVARLLTTKRRWRPAAYALVALTGLALIVASTTRPETLRYYLRFAYGWIPAGAAVAVLIILWRFRRRQGVWASGAQAALAGAVVLAVLAAKTYAGFLPYAHVPQLAVYALPLAAVFLVRLHLVELRRVRGAVLLGTLWLTFLVAAGVGLTLKDARGESAWIRGPGGDLRASPVDARVYQQAVSWLVSAAPPHHPVLVAPQLTGLYILADRPDPMSQISLLPGALVKRGATASAITRLERGHVNVIITDRRRYTEYGQTSFGASFDRTLARWIRAHFVREATLHGANWGERSLDVWVRKSR